MLDLVGAMWLSLSISAQTDPTGRHFYCIIAYQAATNKPQPTQDSSSAYLPELGVWGAGLESSFIDFDGL